MKRALIAVFAGAGLGQTPIAQAGSFVEAAYSYVSIDYKPFHHAEGARLLGQWEVYERLEVFGSASNAEFRPSGVVLGQYMQASNWRDAGLRATVLRHETVSLNLSVSHQSVELDDHRENGYAVHGGLRLQPWSRLTLDLDVAHMHLEIDDFRAAATLAVAVLPSLAITARVIDHSDWDLTFYEAGLRWTF